ncbi:3-deoxy-D-manno-octulosonic acid transferase [uncultured Bilophila sp.]|uniref:3-deoxy-D-manno-octulosonic acid transferase n=1 Tax=uncultured Bilophila sp. TaxID=529385 RepID=UPI0026DC3F63|nr:glycosyltransferase N-terminal domain-containing protein [uncultured Bilophila sp.]
MAKGSLLRALLSGAYSLAWTAATPFLRRHKRLREGFMWRLVPEDWSGPVTRTGSGDTEKTVHAEADIWLQAASGGEAYLVWELLSRIAAQREQAGTPEPLRVLATTWTRQGLEVLQGMAIRLKEAHPWLTVRATFFPLDAPGLMRKALEQARPRVVGLLETELWPGLMLACAKRRIPVLLLNGRMTDKSLKGYLKLDAVAPGFWDGMGPEHVCAISRADAVRFARLFGEDKVEIVPNIKFDRAVAATADDVSDALRTLLPPELHARQTILLASVREQEEPALLSAIQALHAHDAPTIIVAPRHMHRVKPWQALLASAKLPAVMRSKQEGPIPAGSIVIWDTFGELGQLYRLADAVFVGGSLSPLGGQNFLEPLALGKRPCCGPHLDNFAWALEPSEEGASDSLEALGLLERGENAKAIVALLRARLDAPADAADVQERFRAWLAPRLGGSERCAKKLLEAMER